MILPPRPRRWPLAAALLLGSCTVGPDYHRPEPAVPEAFRQAADARLTAGEAQLQRWWSAFGDDTMSQVVQQVAAGNRSLQASLWRIAAARALRDGEAVQGLPKLSASGRLEYFRNSGNGVQAGFGVAPQPENLARVTADVSWELDVFGRIRRQVEADDADLAAQVEDYHDLLVVLRADAATAYVDMRLQAARLVLAQQNVEVQRATLQQARSRVAAGLSPPLDIAEAEQSLAATQASLPGFERDRRLAQNRLEVLLGEYPGTLDFQLAGPGPVPAPPATLGIGVPADLLRDRPDVRAAECRYAAEVARIGVATSELYPAFSLSGFLGFESLDSRELLTRKSRTYDLIPGVHWRLFEWGAVQRGIDAQEAFAEAALSDYQGTVLAAVNEAEDALTRVAQEQLQLADLADAASASERAVGMSRGLYDQGLAPFTSVLLAQQRQLHSQDQLLTARADLTRQCIQLYRVLGGGVPAASAAEARP